MDKAGTVLRIVELPEPCSVCGSTKATVTATDIEAPDGALLMEVSCRGCGETQLLPDELAEGRRRVLGGEDYRPTWFLKDGELIHWATPEGRRLRWQSVFPGVPS